MERSKREKEGGRHEWKKVERETGEIKEERGERKKENMSWYSSFSKKR